jgi:Tle cognate immunity protein 4 C-terminal domain
MRTRRWISLGVIVILTLAGCGPTAKEKQVIEDLTMNMKTVCMGRFVMDIPRDMKVLGRVELYYGLDESFKTVDVEIESLDSTVEAMRTKASAEAEKIKGYQNWESKGAMLLDYRVIDDRTIYLRQYAGLESSSGSKHALRVLVGKTQLRLSAASYEGVPEAGRYDPGGKVETPEQVANRLLKVARQIRSYEDAEKAGSGFCLGPVVIDSDQDEEQADFYYGMNKNPDLSLRILNRALTPDRPDEQLAQRVRIADGRSDMHVLRNRDTTLGGMQAHEALVRITDEHDNMKLAFVAESIRAKPALSRPHLVVNFGTGGQLSSGEYVGSSLTPNEGIGLWDAIVKSIRLRPDAVRAEQPAASPK